jgi:hypothetical protein
MNRSETMKALSIVQEAYPHFMDGRTPEATLDLWAKLFPSEPFSAVETAILSFIASDTKGFPPNIGQIKEKIAQMNDTEPDEMQAWAIVSRALSRASRAEFAKLPPLIQQCIGSPETFIEWSYMDTDAVDVTIANGFMRTYRAKAQRQREYGKLPDFARGAFPAIEAPKQYALPAARAKDEYGEPTAIPEAAMQKLNAFKALAQNEDLKRAAKIGERIDGLNVAIDSLKQTDRTR